MHVKQLATILTQVAKYSVLQLQYITIQCRALHNCIIIVLVMIDAGLLHSCSYACIRRKLPMHQWSYLQLAILPHQSTLTNSIICSYMKSPCIASEYSCISLCQLYTYIYLSRILCGQITPPTIHTHACKQSIMQSLPYSIQFVTCIRTCMQPHTYSYIYNY